MSKYNTYLAGQKPEIVIKAMSLLKNWYHNQMMTSEINIDSMMTVLREGGPFYTCGNLPRYIERLKETRCANHAE